MRTCRRILIASVALAIASLPAPAKDKWINLTTPNFNLISNAGERETRNVAQKLEQFRFVFLKLFNVQAVATLPVTVIVFKNDDSFKPYKPLYDGKPKNVAGYFQRGDDENLIALTVGHRGERPLGIIFHEYTHLLTSRTLRPWPLWLTEGLAETYSTFDVKEKDVSLGIPISSHVYLLREKFMPLKALFAVDHQSAEYNERDKQGVFYAQSWALTHYLMFSDKAARRNQLVQFILKQQAGADIEKAFAEAFNTDYATMEKGLRRYVGNRTYPIETYTLDATQGERSFAIRSLEDAETHFHLGNLLMRTNRLDEAEAHFKEALALDVNLARTYEGLGFIAMRRDKHQEALEYFKQAVARDSKNHLAHYYFAATMMRAAPTARSQEITERVRESLRTSIKLMPGFAHSYYLLGSLSLSTGEALEEGAQALRTAIKLEPQNQHFAVMLAHLQVQMRDYDGAKKTLAPLLAEGADQTVRPAAESLMNLIEHYTRPLPSEPVARETEEQPMERADPPRLKRRGEDDSRANDREPALPADTTTFRLGIKGRPTLKISGANVISGLLTAIECPNGRMVLVVRTPAKLIRFAVTDVVGLQFFSQDPKFDGKTIGCGPVNRTAFFYYKPMPGTENQYAGDAVAVEFAR